MSANDQTRMQELLQRLDALEASRPAPEASSIQEIARDAIIDELTRLTRSDALAVYRSTGRNGKNLGAVLL